MIKRKKIQLRLRIYGRDDADYTRPLNGPKTEDQAVVSGIMCLTVQLVAYLTDPSLERESQLREAADELEQVKKRLQRTATSMSRHVEVSWPLLCAVREHLRGKFSFRGLVDLAGQYAARVNAAREGNR